MTEKGALKTPSEMKSVMEDQGLDLSKPVVASCGSDIFRKLCLMQIIQAMHTVLTQFVGGCRTSIHVNLLVKYFNTKVKFSVLGVLSRV